MKIVLDAAVALGTLALAAAAIWGEKLRSWLAPPKLLLFPHTFRGTPALLTIPGVIMPSGGTRGMYYHLKVVNLRPWLSVENCRVLLTGLARRGPDNKFDSIPFPVPSPFIWSGENPSREPRTITKKEAIVDFGCLIEGRSRFEPHLHHAANNFNGYVAKGEALRYEVEIDAANFTSPKPQIFEVAWDGEWDPAPEQMERHLRVREIVDRSS